jgi:V8-like Glu-specific endopeptidase
MRRKLTISLGVAGLVAASVAIGISLAPSAQAVADGTPAKEGQFRFAAKLTTNIPIPGGGTRTSGCSGALVAPKWVVTASYCFRDANGDPLNGPVPYRSTAVVGKVDVSATGGYQVSVIRVRQAPGGTIALAELDQAITDVKPIALASQPAKVDEVLRLAGWGATTAVNPTDSTQPPPASTHLMTGQVKVSSVTDTTVGVKGYQPKPTTSPCPLDGGAPFFREGGPHGPELISVDFNGPACPHDQEERTARVDQVASWVREVTGCGGAGGTCGGNGRTDAYARIEAESATMRHGGAPEPTTDFDGGKDIGHLANGDLVCYDKVDFGSEPARQVIFRVASGAPTGILGSVELRLDSPNNPPLTSFPVENTGGWQSWHSIPTSMGYVSTVTGVHTVCLRPAVGHPGDFVSINYFTFTH